MSRQLFGVSVLAAMTVECPRCGAKPAERCLRIKFDSHFAWPSYIQHPHNERLKEIVDVQVKRRQERQLKAWFRCNWQIFTE